VVAVARRDVSERLSRERPHRRPVDLVCLVEWVGHALESRAAGVPLVAAPVLLFTEEHARVGMDRPLAELAVGRPLPDLVTLEVAGVTLERLAQRAGPRLCLSHALPAAVASDPLTQEVQAVVFHRLVVTGEIYGKGA